MSLPITRSFPVIRGKGRARRRPRFVPGLLGLEARALLSTLFVTNDNDSGAGSLRYELGAASAGDTIKFSPRAYGTITLSSGPLQVGTSVDIQGPGANKVTVSGGGSSEVFDVEGGVTATISGLTVADGSDTVPYAYGAGGILNQGTLTLSDVVVTGNSAGSEVFGGGGVSNFGTMKIDDSTISDNTGGYGGGVNNNGPLSITDSTISGNSSGGGAGGIFSFASMSLTRSVVSGNAEGGISIQSGGYRYPTATLTVTDSSVVNNTNDQSASGFGEALGAGIIAFESNVTVSGSTISNNVAKGQLALGAGIFMGEAPFLATSVGTTLTVKDSTFRGNQVIGSGDYGQGFGGAIHVDISGAIAVSGSSFLDNTVTAAGQSQGGAIDLGGITSGNITGSLFSGNQAVVAGGTSPYGGSGTGGAISNESGFVPSVLTISGSTFTNNLAQGGPSGGFGLGGAIINQGNGLTLNLSSSLFVGNSAISGAAGTAFSTNFGGFGGGGALVNSFGAIANISGSTFIGNSATGGAASGAGNSAGPGQGGAIQNSFATLTMTGSNLIGNRAIGGAGTNGATAGNGQGGAIQDYGSLLQVSDGVILGNLAKGGSGGGSGEGGGVAISAGSAAFSGVLISLNSAIGGSGGGKGYGGGLYIATGAITTLTKTKVVANLASTSGGDVYGTYTSG